MLVRRPASLAPGRSRRPALVLRTLARVGLVATMMVAAGGAQCRRSAGPSAPTEPGVLDARPRDPGDGASWDRLASARAADPAGAEVRAIADELLAGEPSLALRLAALRAKAEHAYLQGDDPVAIATAEEGLGLVASDQSQVLVDLAQIRARALARGGDPAAALAALDDPLVRARGGLPPALAWGLRAVAADRNADPAAALEAFARWRAMLSDDDPTALWAEQRLARLAERLDPAARAEVVLRMEDSPGRACLSAQLGEPLPEGAPDWVARCAAAPASIGVLLPRSGPFSAFSDEQLAATLATVEVLATTGPVPPLTWRDSGSTPKAARAGARSLLGEGARVIVGPVGAKNVRAAAAEVEGKAVLVVPGEGHRDTVGVAPRLEERVAVLVAHARAAGCDRVVVLAPDNGYGRRALQAVELHTRGFDKPLVSRSYPPQTTSFGEHVNPVMTALGGDAALLVPDTLARAELVVRQVARAGRMPAREGVPGLVVLTTAEGVSPRTLARARDVLDGVWVAPAAARGPQVQPFEDAYTQMQGEAPGDQGFLVFYALQHAITGRAGPGMGEATLTRVTGGRLVVQPPASAG